MANTFYEINIERTMDMQGRKLVDSIVNESPLLASLPMEESSNGMQHLAEKIVYVDGPGQVDIAAALPTLTLDTKIETINLASFGGKIEVERDKAQLVGGATAYLAKRLPIFQKKLGQSIEYSLIYNSLRAYAIANSNYIKAGGSGSVNYSMLAVRWSEGEVGGLYDPNFYGTGDMTDIMALSNGGVYLNSSGVEVYGWSVRSNLGIQMLNENYVSTMVNIDLTNAAASFTPELVDELIYKARLEDGRGAIYVHPRVMAYMQKFKGDRLQVLTDAQNVDRRFLAYNGVQLISSRNFINGTETTVS